jgi:hypothetical protein
MVHTTGWLKGLQVTADGTGIVSHAGAALVRALADSTALTAGLSRALASGRLLVHDRGRVLAGLACAIAGGAGVISDFRVMGDQQELFGLVASVPTAWRTLDEIARGRDRALGKITGGERAPAAGPGGHRGPARRAARHPHRGQDDRGCVLHPAGRQRGDLPQTRKGPSRTSRDSATTRCV